MNKLFIAKSSNYKLPENSFESREECREHYSWVEDLEIEEITERELLEKQLPPEFRTVISYSAYERGHSAGEEEINLLFCNMARDFIPVIEAYTKRIQIPTGTYK